MGTTKQKRPPGRNTVMIERTVASTSRTCSSTAKE